MGDRRSGLVRTHSRLLRFALAATLAIVGAFWFAVDFSSSHAANPDTIVAGDTGTAAAILTVPEGASPQPWFSRAALGALVAGGAIPDPPFALVLAVAGCYLLGRMSFKRWSMRR